jgi:phosphoglycolate phosphatase
VASSVLVLWDLDYTLLRAGRVGPALYRLALQEMFECDLPSMTVAMAGRTDRAIAVDVLLAAGVDDPRAVLDQFQAVLARHAPALAE